MHYEGILLFSTYLFHTIKLSTMKKSFLSLLSICFCLAGNAQVVINEIMQSNIDCIMDDLNDFPDSWVEIYNGTDAEINLSSYKIGLTDAAEEAYQLTDKVVPAKGYALIYCDKVGSGLHTDFRIDSGKGALYLFSGNEIVDKYEKIAKQPAPNIAYGRTTDGASKFGYQQTPTPGAANCGKTCKELLGAPVFSEPGAVFTSSSRLVLHLTLPEGAPEGTIIRYTTDGSEPTLENGITYSDESPIKTAQTLVVRAKLFCDGYLSPRASVQSYVYLNREQTLPVISISLDDKYLNDSKIGIYVEGDYAAGEKNYNYDWRRPMNIELYETDGTTQSLNQLGEMRISGGYTRQWTLKSLAIYANKRFGEKRFKYEFFPDQRPGQTNYKSVLLRNAGNDFDYLYMRDAIIQRSMSSRVDMDWQAWRPAIVYINGVYKGILNIRERSNDDNIFTNYNELEDIDMIENQELKVGSFDNMNAFKEFYSEQGHTMEEYSKWLDINEFINVYAMNLFFNNQDWPGNNSVWWRPTAEGGLWRIIAKDTDFGMGLYGSASNYNTMAWFYNPNYDSSRPANTEEATRLFRHMMEDSDFQREFIDHCAVYMGDFMNINGVRKVWDPMYDIIKTEYPNHRALFNPWWPNYTDEVNNARKWVEQRPGYFYSQLQSQYSLGKVQTLKLNTSAIDSDIKEKIQIEINNIPLTKPEFDGKFFAGRALNIVVRALTAEELAAKGIEGDPVDIKVSNWKVNSTNYTTEDLSIKMPNASTTITPTVEIATGIDIVETSSTANNSSALYDVQGRISTGARKSGVYISRTANGKTKKIIIK